MELEAPEHLALLYALGFCDRTLCTPGCTHAQRTASARPHTSPVCYDMHLSASLTHHATPQAVGFEGPVELEAPQHTFWVVTVNSDGEAGMPEMPTRWVFGRQVALGDRWVVVLGWGGGGVLDRRGTRGARVMGCRCRCK